MLGTSIDQSAELLCPLCAVVIPGTAQFQKHLGRHLEEIALFSLPQDTPDFDDDVSSNESTVSNPPDRGIDMNFIQPISPFPDGINTRFKIFEVLYQLKAVDEQTKSLLSITQQIESAIRGVRPLRRLKDSLLSPQEGPWMDRVIEDTEASLRAVAQLIEPARVDMETNKVVNLSNRVLWVFRDNPKVRDKLALLSVCQQSLSLVIECLNSHNEVIDSPHPLGPLMDGFD